MLSVRELLKIARSMRQDEFRRQLGPFVLVQRPPDLVTQQKALQLGAKRTMFVKPKSPVDEVSLLFEFDDLMIATLPPMAQGDRLGVGRLPDSDLVIDDSSVSKHHATIEWDSEANAALVEDLGSSNGTLLNGERLNVKLRAKDGDTITFGEARFCLLHTDTLFLKLTTGRFRAS